MARGLPAWHNPTESEETVIEAKLITSGATEGSEGEGTGAVLSNEFIVAIAVIASTAGVTTRANASSV